MPHLVSRIFDNKEPRQSATNKLAKLLTRGQEISLITGPEAKRYAG